MFNDKKFNWINIAGSTPVIDPSYRYKMPPLTTKIEGRGNGIKTVLTNIIELGESLNRDHEEITKFFGYELGAQMTIDDDRYILSGSHQTSALQTRLCKYIEKFVLCYKCKKPETVYKISSRDGLVSQKCGGCGHQAPVDMRHKVVSFILTQRKRTDDLAAAEEKRLKKEAKKDKKVPVTDTTLTDASSEAAEQPILQQSTLLPKEPKPKKSKKSSLAFDPDSASDNDEGGEQFGRVGKPDKGSSNQDVDDGETDSAAVGMTHMLNSLLLLLLSYYFILTILFVYLLYYSCIHVNIIYTDTCIARYSAWFAQNHETKGQAAVLEELRMTQTFASLPILYRPVIFVGSLFTEALVSGKEISIYKEYLMSITGSNMITQRYLIAAFEWFCGTRYPTLTKLFPVVLKQLFDEEMVEEEVFLAWSCDCTRNEYSCDVSLVSDEVLEGLKASAGPFVTWLQEAEEAEGDNED